MIGKKILDLAPCPENNRNSEGAFIDRNRHCVLQSPHPSPLSAYRGFFGNKHFSRTNEYLVQHGYKPIDW